MASQRVGQQVIGFDVAGRCAGWVSVTEKRFAGGADPTGVADSTEAIQAALDYAGASGGEVLIPRGTYLTGPLTIPADVAVRGEARRRVTLNLTGMTTGAVGLTVAAGPAQIRGLTLQQTGGAPDGTTIRVSGVATAYHTVLEDLEIVAGNTGIEMHTTYGVKVRDVVLRRFDYGVRLHDNGLGWPGEVTTVTFDGVAFNDWCNVACIDALGAVTNIRVRDSIIQGGNSAATAAVVLTPSTLAWPTAITFHGVWFETGSGASAYPSALRINANVSGNFVNGVSITDSTFGGGYGVSCLVLNGGSRLRLERNWNASSAVLTTGLSTSRAIRGEWNSNLIVGHENLAYSATVTPDATRGSVQWVSATNATPFTFAAPLTPTIGAMLTLAVRNLSGGTLGAITWNAVFKTATGATWDAADDATATTARPATGFQRSVSFLYDGTNWVEIGRTPADVPN
jgi:hypothetical protein